MSRDQSDQHGFGICVKGGKDAGHGVYVSRIEENSLAERAGLRPGDSILEVNGTPFTSVSHEEALKVQYKEFDLHSNSVYRPITRTLAQVHPSISVSPFSVSVVFVHTYTHKHKIQIYPVNFPDWNPIEIIIVG